MAEATLPYYYETDVRWTGQRKGDLTSAGRPPLQVAAPVEFQGHEGMWTPEHYFVAAVSSCFMTTFLAIAELSKLDVASLDCGAEGKLEKVEGIGFQITEIVIKPKLVTRHGKDLERAVRILEKADRNCLVSHSIKTRVTLQIEPVTAEQP